MHTHAHTQTRTRTHIRTKTYTAAAAYAGMRDSSLLFCVWCNGVTYVEPKHYHQLVRSYPLRHFVPSL